MLHLLDVNVLIALTNPAHAHHRLAHQWFSEVDHWATTPVTETAFVRLMLNPAVAGRRILSAEVLSVLRQLQALPGHSFLADDSSLADPAIDLITMIGHHQVTDRHLVNLAAHHNAVLATFDASLLDALVPQDRRHVHLISAQGTVGNSAG